MSASAAADAAGVSANSPTAAASTRGAISSSKSREYLRASHNLSIYRTVSIPLLLDWCLLG